MKRIASISLIVSLFAFVVACDQKLEIDPDKFTHTYDATQCADPWGSLSEKAVKDYLHEQGIEVKRIEIEAAPADLVVCEACVCISGEVVYVKVESEEFEALEQLGFEKIIR